MTCTSLHTKTSDIQRIPSHHICQSFFFKRGRCQWLMEWPTFPKLIELVPKTSFCVRFMVRFSPPIIHLGLNLAPYLLPNFNWWTHYQVDPNESPKLRSLGLKFSLGISDLPSGHFHQEIGAKILPNQLSSLSWWLKI